MADLSFNSNAVLGAPTNRCVYFYVYENVLRHEWWHYDLWFFATVLAPNPQNCIAILLANRTCNEIITYNGTAEIVQQLDRNEEHCIDCAVKESLRIQEIARARIKLFFYQINKIIIIKCTFEATINGPETVHALHLKYPKSFPLFNLFLKRKWKERHERPQNKVKKKSRLEGEKNEWSSSFQLLFRQQLRSNPPSSCDVAPCLEGNCICYTEIHINIYH